MQQRERNRIKRLYSSINFPGSFSGVRKFKQQLEKHAGIKISERKLAEILHEHLNYQMSYIQPKSSKRRRIHSRGTSSFKI